jgi:hypothetical protein
VVRVEELCQHLPGGTEESHEKITQDIRPPDQYLNPETPEYEAGLLTTRQRCSPWGHYILNRRKLFICA